MPGKTTIDINSDVGEGFGIYTLGLDEEVIPLISSANIACAYHAGDPAVMRKTISLCKKNGVAPGAHPGFPDLLGFGRRFMDATLEEIKDYVLYQVGALQAFARLQGLRLQHIKPHGGLYNYAARNVEIWAAVAQVMAGLDADLLLVALAGPNRKELEEIGKQEGIRFAFEFFADRAYNPDGTLVSQREPGAVIHDAQAVAQRILRVVTQGSVIAREGTVIPLKADTICVHGDNPEAVALVQTIRDVLTREGVAIEPMQKFL